VHFYPPSLSRVAGRPVCPVRAMAAGRPPVTLALKSR
jgi:hypothetical protein